MRELTTDTFDAAISEGVHLVKFGAEWCGPCKTMETPLKNLSENGTSVFGVDIDKECDLVDRFNIRNVPLFVVIKDGAEVKRIAGATTANILQNAVDEA